MGIMLLLNFSLLCIDFLAWPVVALGYPLFASIRAIETGSKYNMRKLVIYWTLFALISLFEYVFLKIIVLIPFWHNMKLVATLWLVMPRFGGACRAYQSLVCPCVSVNLQAFINSFYKPKEEKPPTEENVKEITPTEENATNRKTEKTPPSKESSEEWSCAICGVTITSEKTLNDHFQGKKHKSKCVSLETSKLFVKDPQILEPEKKNAAATQQTRRRRKRNKKVDNLDNHLPTQESQSSKRSVKGKGKVQKGSLPTKKSHPSKQNVKGKAKLQEGPSHLETDSDSESEACRNVAIMLNKLRSSLVEDNGGATVGSQSGPSGVTNTTPPTMFEQLKQCQNKGIIIREPTSGADQNSKGRKRGKKYAKVSELSKGLTKPSAKDKGKGKMP